jgi:hypothetical protein
MGRVEIAVLNWCQCAGKRFLATSGVDLQNPPHFVVVYFLALNPQLDSFFGLGAPFF